MKDYIFYHFIAFGIGFICDMILGDPPWLPHPIRLIGGVIRMIESRWNDEKNTLSNRISGIFLVLEVLFVTEMVVVALLLYFYLRYPYVGLALEAVMTYYILATKALKDESEKIYGLLSDVKDNYSKRRMDRELAPAREHLSMLVGRDTDRLGKEDIIRATVETVTENISDGSVAPLIYTAAFGPVGGFFYKAVNTMDSMVGYRNDKYRTFGWASARFDDILGFIPARISALVMLVTSFFLGSDFDTKNGFEIFRRDRYATKSPNAGQTESVAAGLLNVRLGGDASYFGEIVHKKTIGDDNRVMEIEDIHRAQKLLYATVIVLFLICMIIIGCVYANT